MFLKHESFNPQGTSCELTART